MKMSTRVWSTCLKLGTLAVIFFGKEITAQQSITSIWTGAERTEARYQVYRNWASSLNRDNNEFLVVYPRSSQQVVAITTWAHSLRKNVRVQGYRHSQSPITVSDQDDPSKIVIIDMTRYMRKLRLGSIAVKNQKQSMRLNTVIAEPGASMESLLTFAENNGLGVVMTPIIGGDASVGGVLAIGGHGAGAPALNEKLKQPGFQFGSISNSITELKAVVWDNSTRSYVIKTFLRSDPEIAPFIVHLGRALITEVTLIMGKNYNMRCVSYVDVPGWEIFAHPANSSGLRTFAKMMDDTGRVDVIWYPFTESPWLKLWTIEEKKPAGSRFTNEAYNYQFNSTLDNPQSPGYVFGPQASANLRRGLTQTRTWDIWGPSKNTILYYNRTSSPLVYSGFAVLTNRANVQLVLHDIMKFYLNLLDEYGARGIFPIDQYIKLRVTGLDDPKETLIPGAVAPSLSATGPVKSRPDFNVGVWMNTLTTTRRPFSDEFMRRFEDFAYSRFNGADAIPKPEWSKNWGHSGESGEQRQFRPDFVSKTIPRVIGVEQWNNAVAIFDKYDPHKLFTNKFLREMMVPYSGTRLIRDIPGSHAAINGLELGWGSTINMEHLHFPFPSIRK